MTKRIFKSIFGAAVAVLAVSLMIIMGCMYEYFRGIQKKQLADELGIAAVAVEEDGTEYLEKLPSESYRFTLVADDGTVIYDTKADSEKMENHADREEIREAFETGEGNSIRDSYTVFRKTIYSSRLLSDGTVLRISVDFGSIWTLVYGTFQPFAAVLIIAAVISYFIAKRLSKNIIEPLNGLDLENPLENDSYEEIAPLLKRISRQQKEIYGQLSELERKKQEFTQITENMNEGLILVDENKKIVSINPAAAKLFGAGEDCVGKSFITVSRNREIGFALNSAFENGRSDIKINQSGSTYQIITSRIESEGVSFGAVLLAFDISEQENAARSRIEFTANVSHELKTPLQSIIGSSELIDNNLVKPEDMPRFIGHIHQEATRLLNLIKDIIRLSQLDDGNEILSENVDILATAKEVSQVLSDSAKAKNVEVSVSGENAVIVGTARMIYEIIYNLCDNAIIYNIDGGRVDVSVAEKGSGAVLSVKDTGIGIPEESRQRVFERFYRVDKSRSKASGGTGLGLSIVKHAVQFHNGEIELKSCQGIGTEIIITFPNK